MTLLDIVLLIALALLSGAAAALYARYASAQKSLALSESLRAKAESKSQALESAHITALQDIAALKSSLTNAQERLHEQKIEKERQLEHERAQHESALAKLESQHQLALSTLQEEFAKQQQMQKSELSKQLELQKSALLHENKLLITKDSKALLEEIFTPIKSRVEEYQKTLLQNEARLKENIDNAFKYSQEMSRNAQELGRILKGDKKLRGNFGELQLKSVLESSGLIEGEQYRLQEHFHAEGKRLVPDAIVWLDQSRSIIIDAKFPLPNRLSLESTPESSAQSSPKSSGESSELNALQSPLPNTLQNTLEVDSALAQEIATNLRARIDELASKPYRDFSKSLDSGKSGASAYDFVLLFIPYNNILDLALSADSSLYQYAYARQVYLTTPHTLFMALKTIAITWRHIQSDSNINKAFQEIGALYDKFASLCEDYDKLTRMLDSARGAASDMGTKLRGKGGLESRYEKLKLLGAKTKKSLPKPRALESSDECEEQ